MPEKFYLIYTPPPVFYKKPAGIAPAFVPYEYATEPFPRRRRRGTFL
jgi:hypothetical protein